MADRFPKDRFDDIAPDGRIGAHRSPDGSGRGWVWVVWSALAVVVIVAAGWVWIRVLDDQSGFTSSPVGTSSATSSGSAAPTVAPAVGKKAQVTVLNGTTTASLASDVVKKLRSAGWGNVTAANASDQTIANTVIYYSKASDEKFAKGVQQAVPNGKLVMSDAYAYTGDVVTVVLGSDYKP